MNRLPKLLLLAALLLVGVGAVLALVQPFGLGDEEAGTETAQPDVTDTETETGTETGTGTETDAGTDVDADSSSTTDPDTTATTGAGVPSDDTTSTTGAPSTTAAAPVTSTPGTPTTTPTTRPSGAVGAGGSEAGGGSGLDDEVALPADLRDGLADTGGTSVVGAALLVGLAGLAVRRRLA